MSDMVETVSEDTTKARKAVSRYYVDQDTGDITCYTGGEKTATFSGNLSVIASDVQDRLIREGMIRLLILGTPYEYIVSGEGVPDRVAPGARESGNGGVRRQPSSWLAAIAKVMTDNRIVELKRQGQSKVSQQEREVIGAESLKSAGELTVDQVKAARKLTAVKVAYAELTGSKGSIDDLFAPPVVEESQEAAD